MVSIGDPKKAQLVAPLQQYRDVVPRPASAASSSVSLHTLDEDSDAPPPYTDDDDGTFDGRLSQAIAQVPYAIQTETPPIPEQRLSTGSHTVWTQSASFEEPVMLHSMIKDQSRYPPKYQIHIRGSHTETTRQNNKDSQRCITDFDVRIDMSYLLRSYSRVELIYSGQRGFRGGVLPSTEPDLTQGAPHDLDEQLKAWCAAYCDNKAQWKSFRLQRQIAGHDTDKLRHLVNGALRETGYRGSISISYSTQMAEILVLSPGRVNYWRSLYWLRWVFYLTFLWVITWPILFFMTRKYDVVKAVFPYREDGNVVVSEDEFQWFQKWEYAIKRAALARWQCEIDDSYRRATDAALARGDTFDGRTPSTGNSVVDGIVTIARVMNRRQDGWGHDEY